MPPSIPPAPVLGFSFTGQSTNNPTSQQPGVQLDAEFNRSNGAVGALIGAVSVSLNADGSLKSSAVQAAYAAAAPPPGGTNIADAPSAASALLAQAWAEYMPGPLPASTLAGTGVSGDHFSARWWANYAVTQITAQIAAQDAQIAALIGAFGPGGMPIPAVTIFDHTATYAPQAFVSYGGLIYCANTTVNPGAFNAAQWNAVTGASAPLLLNGGTMTGALTLAADPVVSLGAVTKQYADTKLPLAGGTMTGALTLSGAPTLSLHPTTKTYVDTADALALPKAGGTMTGALTLSGAPTLTLHATTKTYVDTADALALLKAGGTMTGALTLAADPAAALQPATKQYADTKLPLAGGTMTGLLTLSGAPTTTLHATTKTYVDTADALALPKAGGTMTGALTLAADPAAALQPATKQYADTKLPLAGGTMTGLLTLAADPAAALQPATKQYADALVAGNVGRNRLDNGWMEVSQRGTSFSTNGGYTADRWMVYSTSGASTASVGAMSGYSPARNVLQTNSTLAAGQVLQIAQRLEAARTFDLVGQTVTVSFIGACSTSAGTLQGSISLVYPSAADNWGTVTAIPSVNVTLTSAPGRVSATFTNLPAGVANGLQVNLNLTQGSASGSTNFYATGVQLEAGTVPTPLEKRPIQQELALCQRFYQATTQIFGAGYAVAGVTVAQTLLCPPMRAAPTVVTTSNISSNLGSVVVASSTGGGVYAQGVVSANGAFTINVNFTSSADL